MRENTLSRKNPTQNGHWKTMLLITGSARSLRPICRARSLHPTILGAKVTPDFPGTKFLGTKVTPDNFGREVYTRFPGREVLGREGYTRQFWARSLHPTGVNFVPTLWFLKVVVFAFLRFFRLNPVFWTTKPGAIRIFKNQKNEVLEISNLQLEISTLKFK